jgi:hypothetical protein
MNKEPTIKLDPSKLLGFKQMKRASPGNFTSQQAKVGISVPEPSTWMELLMGALFFGFLTLRGYYQRKKSQAGAIAASPVSAGAAGMASRKE